MKRSDKDKTTEELNEETRKLSRQAIIMSVASMLIQAVFFLIKALGNA